MPTPTRTFLNGRSTAVRIPAEFGFKAGEEVFISQEADGAVRIVRAAAFGSFLAALERMRSEGHDPAEDPALPRPGMGLPREVDLAREPSPPYRGTRTQGGGRKKRR